MERTLCKEGSLSDLLISFYLANSQKDEQTAQDLLQRIRSRIESWKTRTPGQTKRKAMVLANIAGWAILKGGIAIISRERGTSHVSV